MSKADNIDKPTQIMIAERKARNAAERQKAREAAELKKGREAAARQYAADNGLQIRHLRLKHIECTPTQSLVVEGQYGGLTVAFRKVPNGTVIELATAVCSIRDRYDRGAGITVAVENFANGHMISLPNYANDAPIDVIEALFGEYIMVPTDRFAQDEVVHRQLSRQGKMEGLLPRPERILSNAQG